MGDALALRSVAIVTGNTGADYLAMVHCYHWHPDQGGMTGFTCVGGIDMR